MRIGCDDKPALAGSGDAPTLATEDTTVEVVDDDKFVQAKNKFSNKTAQSLLDFLFEVFEGSHDEELKTWLKNDKCGAIALMSYTTFEGKLKKTYKDLTSQLGLHKSLITTNIDGAAPGQTSRSLKRALSTDENQEGQCVDAREKELLQERDETWRKIQLMRRKYVNYTVNKSTTGDDIQKWMETRHPSVFKFTGEAGKSNRVFLFSAELFGAEQPEEPWKNCSSTDSFQPILDFICAQKGFLTS